MKIRPQDVVPVKEWRHPQEEEAEQEARALILEMPAGDHVRPRDLQSFSKGRIGFNAACRILEDLEKDDELVRVPGEVLAWQRSQPAGKPSRGYALPLSPREHGTLLRALDWLFTPQVVGFPGEGEGPRPLDPADLPTLRAIRRRMKRPA